MQLVPVIPRPIAGVEEGSEVKGVAAVKPARPVQERTIPPLVSHTHAPAQPLHLSSEEMQQDKRLKAKQEDRRTICRRFKHQTLLEELRSAVDRRRHKYRSTDLQLHIDEEV